MKLIIDIPDNTYANIQEHKRHTGFTILDLIKAIRHGTPIPDNATNGDVIKTMFDTTEEHFYDEDRMVDVYGLDRSDDPSTFYADWWNAPYRKGGK